MSCVLICVVRARELMSDAHVCLAVSSSQMVLPLTANDLPPAVTRFVTLQVKEKLRIKK